MLGSQAFSIGSHSEELQLKIPTAGVTRDRLTQRIECGDKTIDLIDTGGMGFDDPDGLN